MVCSNPINNAIAEQLRSPMGESHLGGFTFKPKRRTDVILSEMVDRISKPKPWFTQSDETLHLGREAVKPLVQPPIRKRPGKKRRRGPRKIHVFRNY